MLNILCVTERGFKFVMTIAPYRHFSDEIDWKRTIDYARKISNGCFVEVI